MSESGVIGRSAYQQHPLAGAVFEKARASEDYVNTAQKAAQALFAVRAGQLGERTAVKGDLNTPVLTPPKQAVAEDAVSMDKLTLLLGQLMELLGDTALSVLDGRLALFKALRESQTNANKALQEKFDNAISEMEGALEAAKAAEGDYEVALEAANNAQKAAAEAESALAGMSPDDPEYEATKAARDEAVLNANQAKSRADSVKEVYVQATKTASEKTKAADKIADEVRAQCGNTPAARQAQEGHLTGVARMTLLMAMFVELVGNNAEASLNNDLAIFEAMQSGRIKEMEKNAAEYEKEVKKAEELNKVMGCVGKILGALLTIVSVVGAAFTGGASLALAAVGVALMVADTVVKAATGVSFMEEAMKPIMEKILKPLMELIGKAISNALEKFGVDKETAQMVGSIVGAIAAALAMVVVIAAVAVVGKNAAAKLASTIGKMMGETMKKLVPSVLKDLAKQSSKTLTQGVSRLTKSLGMKSDSLAIKSYGNTMIQVATAGEVANGAAQAGGGIAQGVFIKRAADAMASFTLARFDMEKMDKCLKEAVEVFAQSQSITQGLLAQMSQTLEAHDATGRAVLRNSHA
ncbi:type III secretion system translocon subunit SctE [Iodobacter fluviatilis]|uniref:Translocator protein BipB n=1 Tax=Iodobacter fluviatilis TaxID=537 RepID=A0A377Q6J3_9NEIS|nr:type III secretion system translocon subunit SctE [Iodobacter fluviatilis]TCU86898.1 type III secretion system translocon protein (YopB/IpaB/SipB family) [Iodobacter fluviatilis]STQ90229.1 Effector protein sipB [Iodobacter fluviatilis]